MSSGAVAAYNVFGISSDEIFYFTRFSEKYVSIIAKFFLFQVMLCFLGVKIPFYFSDHQILPLN